jgi:hypothetical protein
MGYGLLGLNNIPLKGGNRSQFSCVFIDPSGLIKDISVPFHFALRYVYMRPLLYTTSNVEFCWFYNLYFYILLDNMY